MEPAQSTRQTGQNLNIWRLSIDRVNYWLRLNDLAAQISIGNPLQACKGFADRVIDIYNEGKDPGKGKFEKIFPNNAHPQWENRGGFSSVAFYGFYATYAHRLAYAEELTSLGAAPETFSSSQKHYLFFLFGTITKIKRVVFFAFTTSQAFNVIKDFVDYHFPNQIARSLLLEDRVKDVKDRWTVGPILASHTWYKEGQSYEDSPDTLEKIFVTFRATMNAAARIFGEIQSIDRSTSVKITRGSICFHHRAVPIESFPTLVSYLAVVAEGKESGLEGNVPPPPGNFSWLDHLRPVSSYRQILGCRKEAERLLFAALQNPEAPRSFTLCPKWFLDYRQSPQVTWEYVGDKKRKGNPKVWTEAPTTGEILRDIREKVPNVCLEDVSSFFLVFNKSAKQVREGFVNAFDGELFLEGQRIFRAYGLWYIPNANYLQLVQENLRELIRAHLIPRKHPARLMYPWMKGKLKKFDLAPFDCKPADLQKKKSPYLASDGTILCRRLKAPAFNRMTTYKRFHVAVQSLFLEKGRTKINEKDLEGLGILPAKAAELLRILKASHPCLDDKGKIHIPFYEGISGELQDFLENCQDYYEEGHYNSLYDTEKGFLVGDTITPYDIELFDIAFLDPKSEGVYLFHVKEGVDGDHMRTVCSQIRNAARKLKSAMSGTSEMVEAYVDYVYRKKANDPATKRLQSLYREDEFRALLRSFFSRPRENIAFVLTFMDNHSPERFLEEGPEFSEGSKKPEVISSIISKLEIIAVCRDIRAMGFNFKICQVNRNGEVDVEDQAMDPPVMDFEEMRALREFSLEEYDFGVQRLERKMTLGDGSCSFHSVLGEQTDKGYQYRPQGPRSMRETFRNQLSPLYQRAQLRWNHEVISARFLSMFQGVIGKALRNELDDESDHLLMDGLMIGNQALPDYFFAKAREFFNYGNKTPQALLKLLKRHKATTHKTLGSFHQWLQEGNNGAHYLCDIGLRSMLQISQDLTSTYSKNKRTLKALTSQLINALWGRWQTVILNPRYYLSDDELTMIGVMHQKSIVLVQRGTDFSLSVREICDVNPDERVFVYAEGKHFERCVPIENA